MVAKVENGVGIIVAVTLRTESVNSISCKVWEVSEDRTHGTDIGRFHQDWYLLVGPSS